MGVMRLEGADQKARVNKHLLDAIRIDAFAADGFIAEWRRGAVVAFRPLVKPAGPFIGIFLLKMRDRFRGDVAFGDSLDPVFDGETLSLGLRLQRGGLCVRKGNVSRVAGV